MIFHCSRFNSYNHQSLTCRTCNHDVVCGGKDSISNLLLPMENIIFRLLMAGTYKRQEICQVLANIRGVSFEGIKRLVATTLRKVPQNFLVIDRSILQVLPRSPIPTKIFQGLCTQLTPKIWRTFETSYHLDLPKGTKNACLIVTSVPIRRIAKFKKAYLLVNSSQKEKRAFTHMKHLKAIGWKFVWMQEYLWEIFR